jgi:hypothetical protein
MRGLAELERADPGTAAEPSAASGRTPSGSRADQPARRARARRLRSAWGPRQRLLFIGAVIAAVGLAMGAWFYLFRPRVVEADRLAPIQSWALWRDLRHGVDQRPAWEAAYLEFLDRYHRWMIVAATITGVGVVVMASSLLLPKRRPKRRVRKRPPKVRSPGQTADGS